MSSIYHMTLLGDLATLLLNSCKAKKLLEWDGEFGHLDEIVFNAVEWYLTLKDNI